MHNSLKDLPKRVLIDANVLLDASFVNGAARKAIGLLPDLGFSPIIDEMVELEANGILDHFQRITGSRIDLENYLGNYISSSRILRLPPASPISNTAVNRQDHHILSAARHYRAWVLTGDIPLNVQLRAVGISVRLPFDVIMEAVTQDGANPGLEDIIRVVTPTRESGMLFGRVEPGSWAEAKSAGKFTVCDVENIGRIYYDSGTLEWVFDMPTGVSARVKCSLKNREIWAVCGSYSLPGGGKRGSIRIRAGKYPSTVIQNSGFTLKSIDATSMGKATFGHSVNNDEHWNGHLRSIVIGPQGMATNTWREITKIPEGAPNPYDSDALQKVLNSIVEINPGHRLLRFPTEEELRYLHL